MSTKTPTTPTVTTSKLTLTPANRAKIVNAYLSDDKALVRRVRVLLPYTAWTVDEIIAALHESADEEGVTLSLSDSRPTLSRSHAVAKAWVHHKADVIVDGEDEAADAVLADLVKIAARPLKALEPYAEDNGEGGTEYGDITAVAREGARVQFPAFTFAPVHGCGQKAIESIVDTYMAMRLHETPVSASIWVADYRRVVEWIANEYRRSGQEHDTLAASARKGAKGTGGKAKTKGPDTQEPEPTATVDVNKPRGEKTLAEATVVDLIRALRMRVADYTHPLTAQDAREYDEAAQEWERRFDALPLGKAMHPKVKAEGIEAGTITPLVLDPEPAQAPVVEATPVVEEPTPIVVTAALIDDTVARLLSGLTLAR